MKYDDLLRQLTEIGLESSPDALAHFGIKVLRISATLEISNTIEGMVKEIDPDDPSEAEDLKEFTASRNRALEEGLILTYDHASGLVTARFPTMPYTTGFVDDLSYVLSSDGWVCNHVLRSAGADLRWIWRTGHEIEVDTSRF